MPDTPHYGAQTKARKAALDVLFAADQRDRGIMETFSELRSVGGTTFRDYTITIVLGVAEHLDDIDARIQSCLTSTWTVKRMVAVDRCLARIALFELDHTDTPPSSVIAEAVRLAGDLSTDRSPKLLNGLLGAAADTSPSRT